MSKQFDWGGLLALVLFVGLPVGIPLVIGARRAIIAWNVGRRFVPVEATILSSEAKLHVDQPHPHDDIYSSWEPLVRFRYSVDGVDYDTGSYSHEAAMSISLRASEERVKEIVAQYTPGEVVPAFYDKSDPKVAYLHLESPWGGIETMGKTILIATLVYGALVLAVVYIQKRR